MHWSFYIFSAGGTPRTTTGSNVSQHCGAGFQPAVRKPEACKPLAGGRAPATPPASDPTETRTLKGCQRNGGPCSPPGRLKATHCLADFTRELKQASSAWVHDEIGMRLFAWQEGYAAFTVSASARTVVRSYIASQEEHHRKKTFRAELAEMLEKAEAEYDPRYLDWCSHFDAVSAVTLPGSQSFS